MRLLLISLIILAQGVSARDAIQADQTPTQGSAVMNPAKEPSARVFTPIDVRSVSSDLDVKLELIVDSERAEEGRWQDRLVSAD